ncbi:hypothetical protein F2Q68_00022423 [Brassica cretica]|uniref:CHY-type domain-containing protein n=1 Tax=Brassica cretica TaxID=69181 RepID=A0A8S9FZC4_BRACR|nr:hypothetical protein F2Q68_00022423 [Brassica cretica]
MEASPNDRLHFGVMAFGCDHYNRRCQIRAPCCNEVFPCRHCHNESTSTLRNIYDRHELVRQDVKQVICSVCDTEQPVAQVCTNCGVNMGEYFCNICKFFDDNIEATSMPSDYRDKKVWILCNDCNDTTEVNFHIIGQKCGHCRSYNTRAVGPPVLPQ